MNKYTLLLLVLHFVVVNTFGQNIEKNYREAKEYFDKGDYVNAEKKYKAWEVLSNNKGSKELAKAEKCLALKQAADADYSKNDYDSACKKYTELSKLNPKDGLAKQRIKECCPKPESPKPKQPTPLPETNTSAPETTLSASKNIISFDANGGEISINVSTNASTWSFSDNIAWCKITKKSEQMLTLTCEPNTGINRLEGSFYIQALDKQQKINVVQELTKNPVALGDKLFKEKKYDKAFALYTLSASQENAEGQSRLGRMYAEGLGVSENQETAMEWFKKSAVQRNASGQNGLGYIYQIQGNNEEALKWYRRSAQQGLDIAQYNLGVMYEYGFGVKKNEKEAREWYKKSAAQGCPQALEKLKQ